MRSKIEVSFKSGFCYEDLAGRRWHLTMMNSRERRFLRSFVKRARAGVSWPALSTSWREKLLHLYHGVPRKEIAQRPLYAVCQDIESRVGIDQGFFRQRDYRDDLAEMISRRFPSRYRFAKQVGMDEALLSRVLHKKGHLSIDRLEATLAPLGYRLALVRSASHTGQGRTRVATS